MSFQRMVVFLVLASWSSVASGVQITAESVDLNRTVLRMELEGFEEDHVTVQGRAFLQIGIEGEGIVMREGAGYPLLPAIYRSIRIPTTARMEVRVLNQAFHDMEDIALISHKGDLLRTVDPATVPYTFNEVYEKDAFFPGDIAKLREPYLLRDARGIVVEVFPFQYNPVTRTLRVYTALEIEVVAAGEDSRNSLFTPKPDRSFFALQQRQFLNASSRVDPPSEDGDLLVICHGAFMSAAQPLVDWKNSIGLNASMVDVASIGNSASTIKTYITNLYNTSNLAYVLLVGDSAEVATGSYSGGSSDAYYSTITADAYPDLFVGRFSAQSTAQVDTQVERTIAYETEGHALSMGGWNARGLGVASSEGAGAGHYGESDKEHIDLIRGELLGYGFTEVDQVYDPTGTKAHVAAALNEGRRVVNYCGHGSTTSWGSTGFSVSDVNNLVNTGTLPFILSVACVNGNFAGNTCFAEAWLRATYNNEPAGAIACYMSTVNQSWAPPMYAQGNHSTGGNYGAAERFWMEMQQTVAGAWYGGSCCMIDLAGSSGEQEFMNWVLFGDPSLKLFIATAPAMTMVFPDGLPSGLYPPGPEMTVVVQINAGAESYVPGSGYLHYRFDPADSYSAVPFSPVGGNLYEVTVPCTCPGDEPQFYFAAQGDGGTTLLSPPDAPASAHAFSVGFFETVMEDDFETNQGWTVVSQNLSTGEWERVDPSGTDAQPEDDHSVTGTRCFVTDGSGGSMGDYDVDGGPTQLISPVIDLSAGDASIGYYLYFYHSTGGTAQPMEVHVTGNGSTWVKVEEVNDAPAWSFHSFNVSDHVTPTASVQVRFTANDNPNDNIVEALLDDFSVERYLLDPALWADGYAIPVSTGASLRFSMDAGPSNAGKPYLLLGTVSGTSPGTPLPGGYKLPINWDAFTDLVMLLLNSPVFDGFLGNLDASGTAQATLDTFGPLDPSLTGLEAHFAFTLGSPFDFQSNAIPVDFEP